MERCDDENTLPGRVEITDNKRVKMKSLNANSNWEKCRESKSHTPAYILHTQLLLTLQSLNQKLIHSSQMASSEWIMSAATSPPAHRGGRRTEAAATAVGDWDAAALPLVTEEEAKEASEWDRGSGQGDCDSDCDCD